jgi:tetratricopeptide (TPR) repeat protein
MLKWGISFGIQASFLLAMIVAPALSAPTQKALFEIRGKLVSPPGSPSCAFCQVQLEDQAGRSGTTLANGAGDFAFRNLENSVYRIRFKSTDYEDVSMPVMLNSEITLVAVELKVRRSDTNIAGSGGQVVNLFTALEYQPMDVVVLYKKARKNRLKSKFEEAALQYESISQTAPQFYAAHFDLGLSYQAIGRIDDAERQFQIAHRLDSSSAEPLIHLGEVYILRKEWAGATEASIDAIRLNSRLPQPFLNLGMALYCSGMLDLSKDSLERALKLDPKLEEANLLLINIYLNVHDNRRALEQIDFYFSKSGSRSYPAELTALRSQLKSGSLKNEAIEVSVPLKFGSTPKANVCRD